MYDSINSFVSESHNENIQQSVFMKQINQTAQHDSTSATIVQLHGNCMASNY